MSFWGGKTPINEEFGKETRIKENLIEELNHALKALEKEHIHSEGPILSSDSANAMCNILEAVFLHGLKRGFKISNFLGGNVKSSDVNYWTFLVKFTHKDVVSQLTHLGQITTEIGFCRAWIRVAINDGLIESYIDAMIADVATLKTFYHSTSFLRDPEKPGILKRFLQGLGHFLFQLSYNSSVLNMWPNVSLMLSGYMDSPGIPSAVVASKSDSAIMSKTSSSEIVGGQAVKTRSSSSRNIKQATLQPIQGDFDAPYASDRSRSHSRESSVVPDTPHNTPYDATLLNTRDSDIIQKMVIPSDDSRSGPRLDVTPGTPPNTPYDPSLLNKSDAEDIKKLTIAAEKEAAKGQKGHKKKRKKHKEKSAKKSGTLSPASGGSAMSSTPGTPPNTPFDTSLLHSSNIEDIRKMTLDIGEGNNSSCESDVSCPDTCQRMGKSVGVANRRDSCSSASTKGSPEIHYYNGRRKSDSGATMSNVLASHDKASSEDHKEKAIEKMRDAVNGSFGVIEPENTDEPDSIDAHVFGQDALEETGEDELSSLGNRLGETSGWSSAFERSEEYQPVTVRKRERRGRSRESKETYDSLLQNYEPSSVTVNARMSQVIRNLPDLPASVESDGIVEEEEEVVETMDRNLRESDLTVSGEFEVIPVDASITSNNADNKTQSLISIVGEICNEKGLDVQNFQCHGCMKPIGMIYGKCRVCTYDGCYYCLECHDNDEYYVPSRIVHNWDFRKHRVAKDNKCFLIQVQEEPLLNVKKINPLLYEHVDEMMEVYKVRRQLQSLKAYLFTCKQSVADEYRKKLWPKEYLFEQIHLYSLADLLQVFTGQLANNLKKVVRYASKHVYTCALCSQKGFFCEICNNPKVIYPFEIDTTIQCTRCKALYHKECKTDMKPCLKCQRRLLRQSKAGIELKTPDGIDYACVPGDQGQS